MKSLILIYEVVTIMDYELFRIEYKYSEKYCKIEM